MTALDIGPGRTATGFAPDSDFGGTRSGRTTAPLLRVLRSEITWVLRRPRTLIMIGLITLIPVLIGVGIALSDDVFGGGIVALLSGNGLLLPVASMGMLLTMALPVAASFTAADAFAGESAHGTLRALLLAPVSRGRLVLVKSVGVLAAITVTILVTTLVAAVTGLVLLGGSGFLTLSGTTLPFGAGLGRVALIAGYVVLQLAAFASLALALSACTEHPLLSLVGAMGALITFQIVGMIPALGFLSPYLLTTGWQEALMEALRDPMALDVMGESSVRALCYLLIGLSLTTLRVVTKDS
ncbi:ABC transporter permease [Actinoalloteichus spitiensis]|uniref:ABC transporter permease n=1 Tax=Actinoalloteichus spitiensis TaxID=252394 RepID=UPI000363C283|nr:ABC transporter permease subunit [Actinoalloteichus spitiensis]